jgi:hypothetical protein
MAGLGPATHDFLVYPASIIDCQAALLAMLLHDVNGSIWFGWTGKIPLLSHSLKEQVEDLLSVRIRVHLLFHRRVKTSRSVAPS